MQCLCLTLSAEQPVYVSCLGLFKSSNDPHRCHRQCAKYGSIFYIPNSYTDKVFCAVVLLTWLQESDPIFNMRVDVMRPVYNLEPKYRVTILTTEKWTGSPGTPLVVKGLIWFTDGDRGGGLWAICKQKAQYPSR